MCIDRVSTGQTEREKDVLERSYNYLSFLSTACGPVEKACGESGQCVSLCVVKAGELTELLLHAGRQVETPHTRGDGVVPLRREGGERDG